MALHNFGIIEISYHINGYYGNNIWPILILSTYPERELKTPTHTYMHISNTQLCNWYLKKCILWCYKVAVILNTCIYLEVYVWCIQAITSTCCYKQSHPCAVTSNHIHVLVQPITSMCCYTQSHPCAVTTNHIHVMLQPITFMCC